MVELSRRWVIAGIGGAVLALGAVGAVVAGRAFMMPEYDPAPVFVEDGYAIRGYDPVAYFDEGEPVAGSESFTASWNGATWRFASAENRETFLDDPEAYAPQYGGFCAWAVAAKGELYSTQPDNWSIVDGKLYLNFNDDVQAQWEEDIPGFIEKGDRRWPEIIAGS